MYPLDNVDLNDKKFKKRLIRNRKRLAFIIWKDNSLIRKLKGTLLKPFLLLASGVLSQKQLIEKIDKEAQKYNKKETEYVAVTNWEFEAPSHKKSDIFDMPAKMLMFEKHLMPVPSNYDSVLRSIYGDYMKLPPEEERCGHHYYSAYRKDEYIHDDK